MSYRAFISYSHSAESATLVRAIQPALERFAKPWYRPRSFRLFRDVTNLTVSPELWPTIEKALGEAEYLIYVASREAAHSKWVHKELAYWCQNKDVRKLLIVKVNGHIGWDETNSDFDWTTTTAVPNVLRRTFPHEPLYVDFAAVPADRLTLDNKDFLDHIASIAAALHGKTKDEIFGDHIRQHGRTMRLAWSVASVLLILTLTAGVLAAMMYWQRHEIQQQYQELVEKKAIADSQRLASAANSVLEKNPDLGLLLSAAAHDSFHTAEARDTLLTALCRAPLLDCYLHGHRRSLTAARFSADGTVLATASGDGTVHCWDPLIRCVDPPLHASRDTYGQDFDIGRVSVSADGKTVAALGTIEYATRTRVVAWDRERRTQKSVPFVAPHIRDLALSPDGMTLALATDEGLLFQSLAEVKGDNAPRVVGRSLRRASRVAFAPDGRTVAVGHEDGKVLLWPCNGGDPDELPVPEKLSAIACIAFSPDGHWLAAADQTTLVIWNLSPRLLWDSIGLPVTGADIHFSPDARKVCVVGAQSASGSKQAVPAVAEWDLQTRLMWRTELAGDAAYVPLCVTCQQGRGFIVAGALREKGVLWDVSQTRGLATRQVGASPWPIEALSFADNGATLVAVDAKENVYRWRAQTGELRAQFPQPTPAEEAKSSPFTIDVGKIWEPLEWVISCGEQVLVTGGCSRKNHAGFAGLVPVEFEFRLRCLKTGKMLPLPYSRYAMTSKVRVAMSPKGTLIASFTPKGIVIRNRTTGVVTEIALDASLDEHSAIAVNESSLVTAMVSQVVLWALTGKEVQKVVLSERTSIDCLAISPNGKLLAGYSHSTRSLAFWDLETHSLIGEKLLLQVESDNTTRPVIMAFSPDGKTLAVGGRVFDRSWAVLCDVEQRKQIGLPHYFRNGGTLALTFSPDGTHLGIGGRDGTVVLWDVRPTTWRDLATRRANRNCTLSEWEQFFGQDHYRKIAPHASAHPSLLNAAQDRAARGEHAQAVALMERWCELQPGANLIPERVVKGFELAAQGQDLARQGKPAEALTALQEGVRLAPHLELNPHDVMRDVTAWALYARAAELGRLGNATEALQAYQTAFELNPQSTYDSKKTPVIISTRISVAAALQDQGRRLAATGDVPNAARRFAEALSVEEVREPAQVTAEALDQLARFFELLERANKTATTGDLAGSAALFNEVLAARELFSGPVVSRLTHLRLERDFFFRSAKNLAVEAAEKEIRRLALTDQFKAADDLATKLRAFQPSRKVRGAEQAVREEAESLAKRGNVDDAVRIFRKIKEAYPGANLEPETLARRLALPVIQSEAQRLAESGHLRRAAGLLEELKTVDSQIRPEPNGEARRWRALALIRQGVAESKAGRIENAVTRFREAQTLDPAVPVTADDWIELCRNGALFGQGAIVLFAGDLAVQQAPGHGGIRSSRGIARALTGDVKGAIEDFESYLTWDGRPGVKGSTTWNDATQRRQGWIDALRARKNPFTFRVVREWRGDW